MRVREVPVDLLEAVYDAMTALRIAAASQTNFYGQRAMSVAFQPVFDELGNIIGAEPVSAHTDMVEYYNRALALLDRELRKKETA